MDVELMGSVAELTPDVSPFQIGTTGRHRNIGFALIGRLKMSWSAGMWNEWFLASDDGRTGWLAEAQGFLSIAYETDELLEAGLTHKLTNLQKIADLARRDPSTVIETGHSSEDPLRLGARFKIGNWTYLVMDIKEAACTGCEGELPVIAKIGRKTTSIDLLNETGRFASIELGEDFRRRTYVGEYVEFDSLALSNVRGLPGWSLPKASTSTTGMKGLSNGG